MAKIKLNGDTSGYIEISAPAVSGNNTLELGPGTKILTNLDNTFTGVSTFSGDVNITSGNLALSHATPMVVASNGSGHLRLGAGGSEKVRITSGGKVGIRTDNPKQIFSVVGRANFDLQGDYYGSWINGDSQGSSSFNVGAWHNAGGRMRNEGSHLVLETMNTSHWIQLQPSGGNISVGSNNPNGLLALTASSGRILTLRNSTTGSASGDGSYLALNGSDFQIANAESANVILYTADTERLRIDGSNGHLSYKNSSPPAWSTDSGYANATLGSSAYLRTDTDVNSNFFTLGSNAYRGSSNWQHVNSGWATQLQQSAHTGDLYYSSSSTSGSADGTITWVEHFRATSAGNFGIGENSPSDRLVVQKTNASGDVGVRIKNDTLTDGSASTPTTASLYLTTSTGDFNSFYVQARRYDNDTHFGYSNPRDGGHTPNMIITNDGQIKTPKQPSFFSRPPGAYNISTGGNTVGGTWQDVHNIGSHFSNGTFTAPVAGTYQFTWSVFSQNETTRLDAYIMVNGTVVMREEINGYPNTSANKNGSVHGCYYLSANDNVTYGIYSAAGNQIYVAAAPWTYASGFLVG